MKCLNVFNVRIMDEIIIYLHVALSRCVLFLQWPCASMLCSYVINVANVPSNAYKFSANLAFAVYI